MHKKYIKNKLNSQYSLPDKIRLAWSLIITKFFFNKAKIIRQPSRIRGYKNMKIGKNFVTGQYCRIEAADCIDRNYSLIIGHDVQINDRCHLAAIECVEIGNDVLIASNVYITDHDHGEANLGETIIRPSDRVLVFSPVRIDDGVWIGQNVTILKGVNIGRYSIIAAGAIVTKDVPPFSLVAGIPGRIIKKII